MWNRHCCGMFGYISSGSPTTTCSFLIASRCTILQPRLLCGVHHFWVTCTKIRLSYIGLGSVLKQRSDMHWRYGCNLASWGLPPLAFPNNADAHVLQFPSVFEGTDLAQVNFTQRSRPAVFTILFCLSSPVQMLIKTLFVFSVEPFTAFRLYCMFLFNVVWYFHII